MSLLRLLIVDDSPAIRHALVEAARDVGGFEIHEAEDGLKGLAMCVRISPHVMLTDFEMPMMDGPKLISAMRRTPGGDKVVVAMLTSRSDENATVQALDAGADEFMNKPLRAAEIRARLKAMARTAQLQLNIVSAHVAAQRAQLAAFLSAGLSHELNTPLQSLVSYISYVLEAVLDGAEFRTDKPEEVAQALRTSLDMVSRLTTTAQRFSDFKHVGAGAKPQSVALAPLLVEAMDQAGEEGEQMLPHLDAPSELRVLADPLQLRVGISAVARALLERGAKNMSYRVSPGANPEKCVVTIEAAFENAPSVNSLNDMLEGAFDTDSSTSHAELGLPMANNCLRQNQASMHFTSGTGEALVATIEVPRTE